MRILIVFGTRPEAIKCARVIHGLRSTPGIELRICVTGQHREMLDDVLVPCGIVPDIDLDVMIAGQHLHDVTAKVLSRMPEVFAATTPDWLLVQGDTNTTFAAALAAFYHKIPVAHIEAGLRSHNIQAPWPEEVNRRFVSMVCSLHFAPTPGARDELLREGVAASQIYVTGNTVIDALLHFQARLAEDPELRTDIERQLPFIDPSRRLLLVTSHRRESFDGGIERICQALLDLAARDDVQILYPVHPNRNVREPVERLLKRARSITLLPPLPYLPFIYLMTRASVILTDSGGIQEEAPSLGKPVLVLRDTTERPEAVAASTARLVGTDRACIVATTNRLLDEPAAYAAMSQAQNPFGDGRASERIVAAFLEQRQGRLEQRPGRACAAAG